MLEAQKSRPASVNELERQVAWYMSFYWSVFDHVEKIEFWRAHESTECLGWIGLAFLDAGFAEVALSAASNIVSVVDDCSTKLPAASPNRLAELLIPMRLIRSLARLDDTPGLSDRFAAIELKAAQKLAGWDQIVAALDEREQEILLELEGLHGASVLDPNDPQGLLVRILLRRNREEAEKASQPKPGSQAGQPAADEMAPEAGPPQTAQPEQADVGNCVAQGDRRKDPDPNGIDPGQTSHDIE
jgi:hypothetical protein